MSAIASRITSSTIVYSTVYSGAYQRKHQNSASLAFVREFHRWPHIGPATRKMLPFDDVIMHGWELVWTASLAKSTTTNNKSVMVSQLVKGAYFKSLRWLSSNEVSSSGQLSNFITEESITFQIYSVLAFQWMINTLFYHDVDEIFWPQPIRLLKLGHVTGRGCMSPTWVGRVSDLGKMAFIKSVKTWITLTAHLE